MSTATEYLASARSGAAQAHRQAFAKIEIHREAAAVLAAWAEIEAIAPASAYQASAFLLPWLETLGAARKIEPLFIIAKDRQGQVLALLGLGIVRHGLFRSATFLGGKDSNFNLGLFRPNVAFTATDLLALFRAAAKALGPEAPDVFLLKNQPFEWEGIQNPFAHLPHQLSPSFAYGTTLEKDAQAFFAGKLAKDTRKKLRKKETRLTSMGPVELIDSGHETDRQKLLDAFFAEKIARCKEQAIDGDFSTPAMRAFFERISRPAGSDQPWLELYGLTLGGRVIATYAGAMHRGRFSCVVNSFDADPEIAKSSPGDLLLMKLLARLCERAVGSFDLGIGEARYKETYCNTTIPLFDVVVGLGVKGHILAACHAVASRGKRAIKQNPRAFATLGRWKRALSRMRRGEHAGETQGSALEP